MVTAFNVILLILMCIGFVEATDSRTKEITGTRATILSISAMIGFIISILVL